jgi:glutathione S-transferase
VPQVPAWGEANKPKAQEILRILDEELGFIAGDEYSVADITALVAVQASQGGASAGPRQLRTLASGGLRPHEREGLSVAAGAARV